MTHLVHAELGDILVPTHQQVFEPFNWPRAGAYPLFPYHNRLYGASFVHAGARHELVPHPALLPDAMHGPAHRRPWHVKRHSANRAVLGLSYGADAEWPFAFEAQQTFSLDPHGLTVELSITNRADISAPVAIGWHPYFAARLDCEAMTDAELAYPLDERDVPTGERPVKRSIAALPAMSGYTRHFSHWSQARIMLDDGFSLVVTADPVLDHLAVHRTAHYICIEPVSIAAGALNMSEDDRGGSGLKLLASGNSLTGCVRLRIHHPED